MSLHEQWLALQKEITAARLKLVEISPRGNTTTLAGTVLPHEVVRAHIETLENEANAIKQRLDDEGNGKSTATRIIWKGTQRELADWILKLWRAGKVVASSELNALNQLAVHFVMHDGSEISAKSLQQNLRNRRDIEGKL
jgi:hypothetical protein